MNDRDQKPSLFMNAFRQINERLMKDQTPPNVADNDASSELFGSAKSYFEFLSMIPWSEPWMICLVAFHILCFVGILMTRNHWNTQDVLFFTLLMSVLFSETLNEQAASHWRFFSKENYFDSNGLFISTVLSTPVLFNCIVLIISWLYTAGKSIIDIKRKELKRQSKEKKDK